MQSVIPLEKFHETSQSGSVCSYKCTFQKLGQTDYHLRSNWGPKSPWSVLPTTCIEKLINSQLLAKSTLGLSSFYFCNMIRDCLSWKKIHVYLAICTVFSLRKIIFILPTRPQTLFSQGSAFYQKTFLSSNINRTLLEIICDF